MTGVAEQSLPDERYLHSTACVGRLGHLVTAPRDIPAWLCTCSEGYRLDEERRMRCNAKLARSAGPDHEADQSLPDPEDRYVSLHYLVAWITRRSNSSRWSTAGEVLREALEWAESEAVTLYEIEDEHWPVDLDALLREVHEKTGASSLTVQYHRSRQDSRKRRVTVDWIETPSFSSRCIEGDSLESALRAVLAEVEEGNG